jgi:hypothetical protein
MKHPLRVGRVCRRCLHWRQSWSLDMGVTTCEESAELEGDAFEELIKALEKMHRRVALAAEQTRKKGRLSTEPISSSDRVLFLVLRTLNRIIKT